MKTNETAAQMEVVNRSGIGSGVLASDKRATVACLAPTSLSG
ncbi:hypothetical protein [Acetobacter sp.]